MNSSAPKFLFLDTDDGRTVPMPLSDSEFETLQQLVPPGVPRSRSPAAQMAALIVWGAVAFVIVMGAWHVASRVLQHIGN